MGAKKAATMAKEAEAKAKKAEAKAKEAEAKEVAAARKKKDEDTDNNNTMETPKKVKFTKLNTSKSYKASMKDLKKIDHKAERTPEKSILLKKIDENDTPQSLNKKSSDSKKKRKKRKSSK